MLFLLYQQNIVPTEGLVDELTNQISTATPYSVTVYSLIILILAILAGYFAWEWSRERAFGRKRDEAALGLAEKVSNMTYRLESINGLHEKFTKMDMELTQLKNEVSRADRSSIDAMTKLENAIEKLSDRIKL